MISARDVLITTCRALSIYFAWGGLLLLIYLGSTMPFLPEQGKISPPLFALMSFDLIGALLLWVTAGKVANLWMTLSGGGPPESENPEQTTNGINFWLFSVVLGVAGLVIFCLGLESVTQYVLNLASSDFMEWRMRARLVPPIVASVWYAFCGGLLFSLSGPVARVLTGQAN